MRYYRFKLSAILLLGLGLTGLFAQTPSSNTVTDMDNNVYQTVIIGPQEWMAENLKTSRYNDGTAIPLVTDNKAWSNLTTPGYCWNSNDTFSYKDIYGALYNWYTVETGKLCPSGWHIPTDAEWTILFDFMNDSSEIAADKFKETGTTHWNAKKSYATNETGFTALPGGGRYRYGAFAGVNFYGYWWSATESGTRNAWLWFMYSKSREVSRKDYNKQYGFSVRCLKD
jgi:uncharacterized protein (TIGR02145 family)